MYTAKTVIEMVEVFKTNVHNPVHAQRLVRLLSHYFPEHVINFDLEDCDKILRMEGTFIEAGEVENLLKEQGFVCQVLE